EVESGVLEIHGGSSAGVIHVDAGAILTLAGNFSFNAGSTGSGEGTVEVVGTTMVTGAASVPSLRSSTCTLTGTGTLTVQQPSSWTGGLMAGPGSGEHRLTLAGEGPLMLSEGEKRLLGRVANQGTWIWESGALFAANSNGVSLTNEGVLDFQGDGLSIGGNSWAFNIYNAEGGTIRRSVGEETAVIGKPVHNQGAIEVESGVLEIHGGSSTGLIHVDAGAILTLAGNFSF